MSLPLLLQMEIDLSAQSHKREIAEGFAALRAKLLPERKRDPGQEQLRALMEAMRPAAYPYSAQAMANQANMLIPANQCWPPGGPMDLGLARALGLWR